MRLLSPKYLRIILHPRAERSTLIERTVSQAVSEIVADAMGKVCGAEIKEIETQITAFDCKLSAVTKDTTTTMDHTTVEALAKLSVASGNQLCQLTSDHLQPKELNATVVLPS